jgi:hypothetical protein
MLTDGIPDHWISQYIEDLDLRSKVVSVQNESRDVVLENHTERAGRIGGVLFYGILMRCRSLKQPPFRKS